MRLISQVEAVQHTFAYLYQANIIYYPAVKVDWLLSLTDCEGVESERFAVSDESTFDKVCCSSAIILRENAIENGVNSRFARSVATVAVNHFGV